MSPAILIGDYFNADMQRFNTQLPERGEVVVFILPKNNEFIYVKRIVGLPGDRIQMRDGMLFINDDAVRKHRVDDYVANDPKGAGGGQPIQQFEETLPNGVKYLVLDLVLNGGADNTVEYIVPPEHYFVLGDNRDDSEDSRYLDSVGYIPHNNIIGKATQIYFSPNPSRIGKKIE